MSSDHIIPPIRIGFVGCGDIVTNRHVPAVQQIPGIEASAVADLDKKRLDSLADRHKIAFRFLDYQVLINSPDVDVVAVCAPPKTHAGIALAALEAGKHVFVEKPLFLSLDGYDELTRVNQQTGLKMLVGYNMRWHRLVQAARVFLAGNGLGKITAANSTFSVPHKRIFSGDWRSAPDQGGDLLNDLATHHFDLLRYLLGKDFQEVKATYSRTEAHTETASVTAVMCDGLPTTSIFSSGVEDQNSLVLLGTRGRLILDFYRYDGWQFYPAGKSFPGPWQNAFNSFLNMPRAFLRARQGGDYVLSYQAMWRHFATCISHGQQVGCDLEDGYQASRTALAALQSVGSDQTVLLQNTAETMPRLPILDVQMAEQPPAKLALTAVVVVPDTYDTVRQTMRHLRAQSAARQMEIVFVVPDQMAVAIDEKDLANFYGWKVVELGNISSIARAYAAGVRQASAPIVALTEDHSFPQPDWAESLVAAHRLPWAAVGPGMLNGNPNTLVSWADFYIAYGEWAGHQTQQTVEHLPGHNSCYKRDLLLAFGERLEDMLQAETVLHWTLRMQGHELLLDPAVKTRHLNFAFWSSWIPIQYHSGRMFASARTRDWPSWRRLLFTFASPLIPFVRLRRINKQVRRNHSRGFMLRLLPTLLAGLVLDGLGQMAGYSIGPGDSIARAAAYEFHRLRYIGWTGPAS